MKTCTDALIFLSIAYLSCILAMPVSKRQAPDCTQSARTLREGLEVLRRIAIPANIPRAFRGDIVTFRNRTTALEFVCESLDAFQRMDDEHSGNSTDNTTSSAEFFRERTCSWLNSFGENILPDCAPTEVEFFCRRVRISNLSSRSAYSLGSFIGASTSRWISTFFAQESQESLPNPIREFICRSFNRSCDQIISS